MIERALSEAELPGCSVELTDIAVGEATWWSLGLEVHGGSETLEPTLRAVIESLFRGPPPDGIRLDLATSMSYPRWLGTRS